MCTRAWFLHVLKHGTLTAAFVPEDSWAGEMGKNLTFFPWGLCWFSGTAWIKSYNRELRTTELYPLILLEATASPPNTSRAVFSSWRCWVQYAFFLGPVAYQLLTYFVVTCLSHVCGSPSHKDNRCMGLGLTIWSINYICSDPTSK